jgi:aminoglycoside phosphotransferase (APT) family kinase protein
VHLVAVLDWEMATLGDPLADLGYLCATWAQPDEPEHPMTRLSAATRAPGFANRADLAAWYAERTGRDVSNLSWYEVLALWKSAIFLESSYRRYLLGTTSDPYLETLGAGVPDLAALAASRL